MNQLTDDQTADLRAIGSQLQLAIRRDHERRLRRRSVARSAVAVTATTAALSGTALAAGELSGAIDLGGGHSAVPVNATPAPADARLPYRYELNGVHRHNGSSGTIYIESSKPLTSMTQAEVAAARHQCGSHTMSIKGTTVWVFDTSCALGQR